ncbi:MAG: FtsX-like permease family protein [Candidatus Cloacimonas sp.]|jgi:putative ABC transport system permease protein|nr:FtsX-like permease family protein [Candidatus Cloacimonas sp.]
MFKFLLKGVFRDRHRYLFPLLMVSSGVLIMVFMLALVNGYMDSFIRQSAGFETGHLKVVTRAYAELLSQRPFDLGMLDIQDDLTQWKKTYPQLDWVERIHFGALLDIPDADGLTREQGDVAGFGVDLFSSDRERKLMNLDKALVSGSIPKQPTEVLLSDRALHRLKLKLRDPVTLICSDVYGMMAFKKLVISGTINFGVEALDRGAIIADLSDIRNMLDMEGSAGEILAFFRNGVYDQKTVNDIRDDFNKKFSNSDDEFSPVMLALSDQNNMGTLLGTMQSLLGIFSMVFIIILGIVLWNSGLMNGIRRYGEFGVRLAVGESKRHIYWTLMLEAVIVGFAGSIIGIIFGLLISWYFNIKGMDVSVFNRNSTLMSEDIIYTSINIKTALSGLIPGVLSTLLGAMLAGVAVFKRQTSQLFKELEV